MQINHHADTDMKQSVKKLARFLVDTFIVKIVVYVKRKTKTVSSFDEDNLCQILWKRAQVTSADYIEPKLSSSMLFPSKEGLWDFALSKTKTDGLFAEFGVYTGTSINYFAKRIKNKNISIYGFDSFEGLKEEWYGTELPASAFNLDGKLPKVLPNVTLIKGWFDETLPGFLEKNREPLAFLHLDADTYDSTALVLKLLTGRIQTGTIVVFDEYLGYPNWQLSEFLAWQQFCEREGIRYRYLAFSIYQAAVEIL